MRMQEMPQIFGKLVVLMQQLRSLAQLTLMILLMQQYLQISVVLCLTINIDSKKLSGQNEKIALIKVMCRTTSLTLSSHIIQ
jgi:hypothetical protein